MTRLTVALLALSFSSAAFAQACFGPAPCEPTGPEQLCIATACTPVVYSWDGDFAVAQSVLPNGYPVAGIIGPCRYPDRSQCPDIFNQAFAAMRINALQANRAQNY